MPAHDGSIELTWGGDLRRFRLGIDQLLALQESRNAGPAEIHVRLQYGTWRLEDLQDIFRLGLIGGAEGAGLEGREAKKIVDRTIVPGNIIPHIDPALAILGAALVTAEPLPGKPKGGEDTKAAASPPAPSTATARSSATRRRKSAR